MSLGTARRNEKKNGYAKFGGRGRGANKVHYEKCESGEWSNSSVKNSLRFSDFPRHMLIKAHFYHEKLNLVPNSPNSDRFCE